MHCGKSMNIHNDLYWLKKYSLKSPTYLFNSQHFMRKKSFLPSKKKVLNMPTYLRPSPWSDYHFFWPFPLHRFPMRMIKRYQIQLSLVIWGLCKKWSFILKRTGLTNFGKTYFAKTIWTNCSRAQSGWLFVLQVSLVWAPYPPA